MKKTALYIHGKGGNAAEAEHYKPLFPDCDVIGFDYKAETPWEAKDEFPKLFDRLVKDRGAVTIIANSIGAYFAMHALDAGEIKKAFFISPVVDMEKLISDMLIKANVTEDELNRAGEIKLPYGEMLSMEYLRYSREYPVKWNVPTYILYGENDDLTSLETITGFSDKIGASLTIMKGGEHWFHTGSQMRFLDDWIKRYR